MIIRENKHFRITKMDNVASSSLFVEGKNIFGRWVIGQTISADELPETWQRCEDLAAQSTK